MNGMFLAGTENRSVSDRTRRMAFWGSLAAMLFNTAMHIVIFTSGGLDILRISAFGFYSLLLGVICWTSLRNWHFETVTTLAAGTIYLSMWGALFLSAALDNGSIFALPILIFAPLWLSLFHSSRALFLYTAIQAFLVFYYTNYYAAGVYGFDRDDIDITALAIILAILSATMVTVLSILSYAREKTDKRLLNLVKETERLAAEDPLTGLKNRRAFLRSIEQLWESKAAFAVVFIDLDRFKPLNDEYGHAVGDQVLQTVGKRMQEAPNTLCAARFGGDEFAVLVDARCDDSTLHTRIEALHHHVTETLHIGSAQVMIGASFGYALSIEDGSAVGDLLHAADTAMMRCKASGGGIAKFDPELDERPLGTSAIEDAFRHALDEDKIQSALQPIIDARTGATIGHELLARWPHSGLSRDPSPAEFIPIAEKLGLLNALLWSTLRTATLHLKDQTGFLAINVSPSQLSSRSFLSDLQARLKAWGFSANRLEIEVTEHVAFRNLEDNIRTLNAARDMGCRIVLDDFGSGYSSLSLLEELPIDKVKLDKSLQGTENKRGVLQATIRLARDLGFACCVEGIETEDAATFAVAQGCDEMQGYWFGQPDLIDATSRHLKVAS